MYKLSILSNPKNLVRVRKKTGYIATRAGFTKDEVGNIVLAVDEACTNIIRHSYLSDYTKKINIKVGIKNKQLEIIIRDYGIKPDLKKIIGRRPKKIKPGGLGVYFLRRIMDKVVYDTNNRKGTRLVLVKKIPSPIPSPPGHPCPGHPPRRVVGRGGERARVRGSTICR